MISIQKQDIDVKQPKGSHGKGLHDKVYKLNKSPPDLNNPSRQWYLTFYNVMLEIDYEVNPMIIVFNLGTYNHGRKYREILGEIPKNRRYLAIYRRYLAIYRRFFPIYHMINTGQQRSNALQCLKKYPFVVEGIGVQFTYH